MWVVCGVRGACVASTQEASTQALRRCEAVSATLALPALADGAASSETALLAAVEAAPKAPTNAVQPPQHSLLLHRSRRRVAPPPLCGRGLIAHDGIEVALHREKACRACVEAVELLAHLCEGLCIDKLQLE